MTSICLKNSRGRFSSTLGPDVPPHTTSRPPGRSALTERSQVAGPTLSTTTSTLHRPVRRRVEGRRPPPARAPRVPLGRVA